jgi:hypothetical protein
MCFAVMSGTQDLKEWMGGVDGEWKKAGRDSSTAQADSFAGTKEKKKRRLAPPGMTVMCLRLKLKV